jgi:hypothetical protein
MNQDDWSDYSKKRLRHPRNAELVTGRVNIINQRNVIRISIGKVICNLLEMKKGTRVSVAMHKEDKNLILITKNIDPHSYKLHESTNAKKISNFLSLTFRYDFHEPFRLSQTILLDFDMNDNKLLLIDLKKLKWRN